MDIELTGIQRAVQVMGGQTILADALGVTKQAVYKWMRKGEVPPSRANRIANMTGIPEWQLTPSCFVKPALSSRGRKGNKR